MKDELLCYLDWVEIMSGHEMSDWIRSNDNTLCVEMNKDLLKKILWKSLTREFGGSQEDIVEAQEIIMLEEVKSAKPMEAKKVLKF